MYIIINSDVTKKHTDITKRLVLGILLDML